MNKLFDPVTRAYLLEKGDRFIVTFDEKGCAGLTLSIERVESEDTRLITMQEYIEQPNPDMTPLSLYVTSEHHAHLEGARITRTEKNQKSIYVYTSTQVKSRCGCGKSFGFEEKKVVSNHDKLASKLQAIKNGLKKKSNSDKINTIIDYGEEGERTIQLTEHGQRIHYYLILKNTAYIKRHIVSLADQQDIEISILAIEDGEEDKSKHSIEIIADISGSKTKLRSKSLTLSGRSGHTRVLSGIRVLSGDGQDAHISQRSILLGESASIAQIPLLDVHTPGSHAEHSATIESISREETFYLESRGMSPYHAQKLKLLSMVRSLVDASIISDEDLEADITRILG